MPKYLVEIEETITETRTVTVNAKTPRQAMKMAEHLLLEGSPLLSQADIAVNERTLTPILQEPPL